MESLLRRSPRSLFHPIRPPRYRYTTPSNTIRKPHLHKKKHATIRWLVPKHPETIICTNGYLIWSMGMERFLGREGYDKVNGINSGKSSNLFENADETLYSVDNESCWVDITTATTAPDVNEQNPSINGFHSWRSQTRINIPTPSSSTNLSIAFIQSNFS